MAQDASLSRWKQGFDSPRGRQLSLPAESAQVSRARGRRMSIPQQGGGEVQSRSDLVGFFESGCKPPAQWKIGTEHEKFGFRRADLAPLPYDGDSCSVRGTLEGLAERFGWTRVLEGENLIGLTRDGANVSLEPGGQLELSGAPLDTLHQTCDEASQHLAEVAEVAEEMGAGFLGMGVAPHWRREDMPRMPKGRYAIMRRYMERVGKLGVDMMHRTCTIQVNLDYADEADMVRKLRAGLLLQPVATALFANSPFIDGKDSGYLSYRARIWEDVDGDRSGVPAIALESGFGFEAWTDYALDVPMYFVYRDGSYLDVAGQSFRDFLDGRLPGLPGERPLMSDWADHLTTLFPDARIKQFIEMRGADGGPWRRICALPALWVGLLYDSEALDGALQLAADWSEEERMQLRVEAGRLGLEARVGGRSVRDIARDLLDLSRGGLARRARAHGPLPDETHHLNDLEAVVESGETAAGELLRRWRDEWDGDARRAFEEYSF